VTAWACEFATIANDRELVVHLDQVLKYHPKAASLEFFWLTETLGIEPDEIYGAFWLEGNEPFVDRLYRRVYSDKGGVISIGEEDPMTAGMGRKEVPMKPPGEITAHNDRMHQLSLATGDADWYTWKLLAGDLYLPLEHVGLQHLTGTSKQTGRKAKCYEFMVAFPAPVEMVDEIERRAKALVKAIAAAQEQEEEEVSRVLALQKLRSLLDLQTRHWTAKGTIDHPLEINALGELDDAVRHLIDNAMDRLSSRVGENKAADELLACFDADGKGAELKACLDTIVDHQNAYPKKFVARLNDVLVSAVHVLGQSSRAGDFMRDHWMLLFADACEHEPRLATSMIEELADSDLSAFWAGGWKKDLEALRQVVGRPKKASALAPTVRMSQVAKSATGLVSAAVSDASVIWLLHRIEKYSRATMARPIYRSMAGAMLRFMAGQAMEHHLIHGPVVGERATLKKFIEDIRALRGKSGKAWFDAGKEFNHDYDFSGRWRRFAPGIGLNVIAAYVTLCYAWDDDEQWLVVRVLNFTSGLMSTASAGVALGEAIQVALAKGVLDRPVIEGLKKVGRGFTLAGAFLSLAATGIAVCRDVQRSDYYSVGVNSFSGIAGGLTTAGAWVTFAGNAALGGLLSGGGVILGGVVLLMVVFDSGDGPVELAEAYLRYARDGWPVAADPQGMVVRRRLDDALRVGAFEAMKPVVGRRGQELGSGKRPTLHFAFELGFEVQELRKLFHNPTIALEVAGLREASYDRPARGSGR
jgi:hypothetical protein